MKRCAAFTITRNEPFWLRVWCNYYCEYFPEEDVYIIDNSSDDDSIAEVRRRHPGINIVSRPNPTAFDHLWLKRTVEGEQRDLLRSYRVVLFSETDEFLIPDLMKWPNIYSFCDAYVDDGELPTALRATGWGVVHQIDSEPPISHYMDQPLLLHRTHMWRLPDYDKTLITKVPLAYSKGFHLTYSRQTNGRKEVDRPVHPGLILLHAWQLDLDTYMERHLQRVAAGAKGFHGSSDRLAVEEFFRTRVEPWNADRLSPLYADDHADLPELWHQLLRY